MAEAKLGNPAVAGLGGFGIISMAAPNLPQPPCGCENRFNASNQLSYSFTTKLPW